MSRQGQIPVSDLLNISQYFVILCKIDSLDMSGHVWTRLETSGHVWTRLDIERIEIIESFELF